VAVSEYGGPTSLSLRFDKKVSAAQPDRLMAAGRIDETN
jgi:hypothetical protein